MSELQHTVLNMSPELALFEGQVQGLIVSLYENERPLSGLSGKLDWYFKGAISRCIQKGFFSGKQGECTYFPISHFEATLHLLLVGAGRSKKPGDRGPATGETLQVLHKNLISLKLSKIGFSKSDFGNISPEQLSKSMKGVPLWITL